MSYPWAECQIIIALIYGAGLDLGRDDLSQVAVICQIFFIEFAICMCSSDLISDFQLD